LETGASQTAAETSKQFRCAGRARWEV